MEFHDIPTDCVVADTKWQVDGRTDESNFDTMDSFVLLRKESLKATS
jgi:hypothetical protein